MRKGITTGPFHPDGTFRDMIHKTIGLSFLGALEDCPDMRFAVSVETGFYDQTEPKVMVFVVE